MSGAWGRGLTLVPGVTQAHGAGVRVETVSDEGVGAGTCGAWVPGGGRGELEAGLGPCLCLLA